MRNRVPGPAFTVWMTENRIARAFTGCVIVGLSLLVAWAFVESGDLLVAVGAFVFAAGVSLLIWWTPLSRMRAGLLQIGMGMGLGMGAPKPGDSFSPEVFTILRLYLVFSGETHIIRV